ncbi:protein BTG1-like [Oscarella lobularis]|uniref:protein BTG1-like n=1 Tax=Oscarella lobularis TaxID=121494 RepID=UPI0033131932
MHVEIEIAGDFVVSFLTDLSMEKIEELHYNLSKILTDRYEGHWYPSQPTKGNAYRCLNVAQGAVDPILNRAIRRSGLNPNEIRGYFPENLSVWVDPNEVSYRVGDRGPTETLYCESSQRAGTGYDFPAVEPSQKVAATSGYSWESPRVVYRDYAPQFDSYTSAESSSDSEYSDDGNFVTYGGEMLNRHVFATAYGAASPHHRSPSTVGAYQLYDGNGHVSGYSPHHHHHHHVMGGEVSRKTTVVY